MRLTLFCFASLMFLAVSPPVTSTPVFGVTTSSDPLQVAALAGGLLLAFKLGAKLGSRNRGRGRGRGRGNRNRGRGRGRCRRCHGKRQAEQEELMEEEEMIEAFFEEVDSAGLTGCFERLVCDIAASPEQFDEDAPIIEAIKIGTTTVSDKSAKSVVTALEEAMLIGQNSADLGTCEKTFDQCKYTGLQMKNQIHEVLVQSNETQ